MRTPIGPLLLTVAAAAAAGAQPPATGEFRGNTYTTSTQIRASVAGDARGDFILVWMSLDQDGSGYGMFGQRYTAGGVPKGAEFQVNTAAAGNQMQFSRHAVSAHPDGGFVVVWESVAGAGLGVFGQRYDPARAKG